jgi:hypothetical protein
MFRKNTDQQKELVKNMENIKSKIIVNGKNLSIEEALQYFNDNPEKKKPIKSYMWQAG